MARKIKHKKQSKLKKIVGFFNPKTLKGGMALFALVFALGGGGYLVYRSFAASVYAGDPADKHTCWIKDSDKTLWCWGPNNYGQLGLGDTDYRPKPSKLSAIDSVTKVATGNNHTCATKTDGSLWCWGKNWDGQLGIGSSGYGYIKKSPAQVSGFYDSTVHITAGGDHTCATKTNGTMWCWGNNATGQLGDETITNKSYPRQIPYFSNIGYIAAGGKHTCAIRKTVDNINDLIYCWGSNKYGQLGINSTTNKTTPTPLYFINAGEITAGQGHTCATSKTDGSLWCWGDNYNGQIGDGTTTRRLYPQKVKSSSSSYFSGTLRVTAGGYHTCARKSDGTLWCWGDNQYGQLGDGTLTSKRYPKQVLNFYNTGPTRARGFHTCAIKTDGTLWCWGWNDYGQLGLDNTIDREQPTKITYPNFN